MSFVEAMKGRSAERYADFFLPHLRPDDRVLDCGCGMGTITVGLARYVPEGSVVGIDIESNEFQPAIEYLEQEGIDNINFREASMLDLPFATETFSACFCHSAIETLDDPIRALQEVQRVLKPGGLIGVACVEYEGVLLAGAQESRLRKFYAVREQLWQLEHVADPRRGKHLRKLLHSAGYGEVKAQATYLSYGDHDEVAMFGTSRTADCDDPGYVEGAVKHGLLTRDELKEIQAAWQEWSQADDSFAAFTWCRATGRKIN